MDKQGINSLKVWLEEIEDNIKELKKARGSDLYSFKTLKKEFKEAEKDLPIKIKKLEREIKKKQERLNEIRDTLNPILVLDSL